MSATDTNYGYPTSEQIRLAFNDGWWRAETYHGLTICPQRLRFIDAIRESGWLRVSNAIPLSESIEILSEQLP